MRLRSRPGTAPRLIRPTAIARACPSTPASRHHARGLRRTPAGRSRPRPLAERETGDARSGCADAGQRCGHPAGRLDRLVGPEAAERPGGRTEQPSGSCRTVMSSVLWRSRRPRVAPKVLGAGGWGAGEGGARAGGQRRALQQRETPTERTVRRPARTLAAASAAARGVQTKLPSRTRRYIWRGAARRPRRARGRSSAGRPCGGSPGMRAARTPAGNPPAGRREWTLNGDLLAVGERVRQAVAGVVNRVLPLPGECRQHDEHLDGGAPPGRGGDQRHGRASLQGADAQLVQTGAPRRDPHAQRAAALRTA